MHVPAEHRHEAPMLSSTYQVERTAAAGGARSVVASCAPAGSFAPGRMWTIGNPSIAGVTTVKHDLTPAQRPEEAVPR